MKTRNCPVKPSIRERDLLSSQQAGNLEELFQVLASDTRLKLLHALIKEKELCVSEISERLEMKPQAISNQLQRLSDRAILASRRDGNQIFYRVIDPCVSELIDLGLCLLEDFERKQP